MGCVQKPGVMQDKLEINTVFQTYLEMDVRVAPFLAGIRRWAKVCTSQSVCVRLD